MEDDSKVWSHDGLAWGNREPRRILTERMVDPSKYVEWIKLSPRYLLPIAFVTGFLLFAPEKWLAVFGLVGFVDDYRPWLGVACLLSTALILSAGTVGLYGWVRRRRNKKQLRKAMKRRLHYLTEDEKEILRGYIEEGTRTQYHSITDGVVGGLVAEHILVRASNLSESFDYFAYNIQPWAWEYLNKNRKLLS